MKIGWTQKVVYKMLENKFVILLYLFATSFFVYQHSTGLSWDFSSYVLNAKYLFGNGFYFEWYRAPFTPFLLGVLSVFGWRCVEYAYIVLVSTLFMFSCIKLAEKLNISKDLFYSLLLTPFLLNHGLKEGTELLSLSLLQLSVAYLEENISGIFFSLATLTRYTNFIYLPLILFKKSMKSVIISCCLFSIPFLPWFLFNWYSTSNPLTSLIDAYALNVKFRDYMVMSPKLMDVMSVIGYYLPLFLLGICTKIAKLKKVDLVMVCFLILTLISYCRVPFKTPRYLFNLILPVSYFSSFLIRDKTPKIIPLSIFILNFMLGSLFFLRLEDPTVYRNLISELDECMLRSNAWVYFNYQGIPTDVAPRKELVKQEIERGKRILLFKHIEEPEYVKDENFLKQFKTIKKTEEYIILGDPTKCAPRYKVNKTYLQRLKEDVGIEVSTCELFLPKKLCSMV